MSTTWILIVLMPIVFVAGGLLGYRLGVVAGYESAEEKIKDITTAHWRKLRAQQTRRPPSAIP